MGIFQRGERETSVGIDDQIDDDIDEARRGLRDEVDVDPLVEEATARLREELRHLVARDEWGRELAWRYVARIALGPVLTKLRDQETTIRLLAATQPDATVAERSGDDDLLDALESALDEAPPLEQLATQQAAGEPAIIEQAGPVEPATPDTTAPSAGDVHLRWTT